MTEPLDVRSDDVNYHDVYFDNFFTSLPLLKYLQTQEIHATGIVRANRLLKEPLPTPKEMQKKERGNIEVYSASNVCVVQWVDNKVVILASKHHTKELLNTCNGTTKPRKHD